MQHDAIVIGGSFAGLSAAIQIARARRRVCVIDAGQPRNRFAATSHGFFGQDGSAPRAMIAQARAQVEAYPTVEILTGTAHAARAVPGGFEVEVDGARLTAARLVLAFGVSDVLPDLPGLAERWGRSVLHCPYCHGFERAGGRLGVLSASPMSAHQAMLISEWGPTTLYLDGGPAPEAEVLEKLAQHGVAIDPAGVTALVGADGDLSHLRLADGREATIDALYVAPRCRLNSPMAAQLGCALDDGPFGPLIRTDERKQTSVAGVYAAGDIARAPHNASWAAADGVTAGVFLHQSLVFAPLAA